MAARNRHGLTPLDHLRERRYEPLGKEPWERLLGGFLTAQVLEVQANSLKVRVESVHSKYPEVERLARERGALILPCGLLDDVPEPGDILRCAKGLAHGQDKVCAPRTGGGSTSNGSGEKPPVAPMVVSLVSSSIDLLRPLRRERASMDIDDKKDVHEESHARRHKLVRDEPREGAPHRAPKLALHVNANRELFEAIADNDPARVSAWLARGASQPPRRVRADAALPGGVGVEGPGHRRAAA